MYTASADISLYHLGSTASAWQASKSFQVISAPSSRHNWVKIFKVSGKTPIGIHME